MRYDKGNIFGGIVMTTFADYFTPISAKEANAQLQTGTILFFLSDVRLVPIAAVLSQN